MSPLPVQGKQPYTPGTQGSPYFGSVPLTNYFSGLTAGKASAKKKWLDDLLASYSDETVPMLAYGQKALKASQGGYKNALDALFKEGELGRRDILDREGRNLADTSQDLTSRGLFNTTRATNENRAIRSDTDRSLGGLTSALATQRAQLEINQGQALQQALAMLSQLFQQRAQGRADISLQGQSILQNAPIKQSHTLETLLGAAATFFGAKK